MDEQKLPAQTPVRGCVVLSVLLFVWTLLPGCFSPEPQFVFTESNVRFAELTESIAALRELPLKRALRIEVHGAQRGKTAVQLYPAEYYGSVPILQIESIYKAIGLLPQDIDLALALAEYEKILQLVTYDSATGLISIAPGAVRLGQRLAKINPIAAREFPAVIGIVRALQEQHFNSVRQIDSSFFEDRRLALRAIVFGDASMTAVSRVVTQRSREIPSEKLGAMFQVAKQIDKLAAHLPHFLRVQSTFPYREGSQFAYWAYAARGWQGVNALYGNPPITTAQILHPEKYFVRRENPLRFFPASLLHRLKDRVVIEESLGELFIRSLLETTLPSKEAAETAAGWRGDQLFSFGSDTNFITFWFSAWQDETSAREFLRVYRDVLERRHGVRFDSIREAKNRTVIARARGGRAWLLQSRGAVVLALSNGLGDQLTAAAEEGWKDLEIDSEVPAVRFESAQASVNFR